MDVVATSSEVANRNRKNTNQCRFNLVFNQSELGAWSRLGAGFIGIWNGMGAGSRLVAGYRLGPGLGGLD